jgi:hypothetical protein
MVGEGDGHDGRVAPAPVGVFINFEEQLLGRPGVKYLHGLCPTPVAFRESVTISTAPKESKSKS